MTDKQETPAPTAEDLQKLRQDIQSLQQQIATRRTDREVLDGIERSLIQILPAIINSLNGISKKLDVITDGLKKVGAVTVPKD